MDTLSSSVSTFKVPSLPPHHRELHHFKTTPYASTHRQAQAQTQAQTHITLIPKTKPISHKDLVFSEKTPSPPSANPIFYRKPATGYAAALIAAAQTSDSLHLVHSDVRRLLKSARSEEDTATAARAVVEQKERGRFDRHVVALVKMLVKKNKSAIVREVMEEFERIYDELCGTQVVLVSSEKKMEEDQLFGIAENVQKLSGAVKVKVRNLIHESLPSFAV